MNFEGLGYFFGEREGEREEGRGIEVGGEGRRERDLER